MPDFIKGGLKLVKADEFGTVYKFDPPRYTTPIGPAEQMAHQRGVATHCAVCGRRFRNWGVRAAADPAGVQRGDTRRCVGCKDGDKEIITVTELTETETQWVERNVPTDLHWYFGVAND